MYPFWPVPVLMRLKEPLEVGAYQDFPSFMGLSFILFLAILSLQIIACLYSIKLFTQMTVRKPRDKRKIYPEMPMAPL